MADRTIEERLDRLEEQVSNLMKLQAGKEDWKRTIGMFGDDETMKAIDTAGAAIRQKERDEAKAKMEQAKRSSQSKRKKK